MVCSNYERQDMGVDKSQTGVKAMVMENADNMACEKRFLILAKF